MSDVSNLEQRLAQLEHWRETFDRPDRFAMQKDIEIFGDRKLLGFCYAGSVASTGTATRIPAGWTSTKTATGKYKITHNLNTTNYAVIPGGGTASDSASIGTAITSTYFEVYLTALGSPADGNFYFILMKT